ncbi:MAG: sigma-54-dependent Fis family transcriptional regulator [Nitrospirae bacterium]|nr:sigma-54-dependent Fis family transcriptional regulator [Nitrospirota bacterium]MBF0534570.1 sigma-54-dependent Fis family transcriptional regulator [Nitrospirota bacterium]MBF0617605.1 sigma-54-dependent Fis family transcriptional regulator [Nitrospirota bacterium]
MKEMILLIEDEKLMRVTLEDALKEKGYEVMSFDTGTGALNALKHNSFDVAVTDVRLPDMDGFDIVREITGRNVTQVIVMTAYGTIKDAVEAMKLGAFDYITKPFALDEFLLLIARALEMKRLREENIRLKKDLRRCYSAPNIIGESPGMKKVFSLISNVSSLDTTVLILGESGTGKELVATTIHYQSKRNEKPLIKVNCAALPDGLIESELFGYEKGAFTGALKRKPGRFELAHGGTIFLDEIGDISLLNQAKILRVIQERQFERVGGTATLDVDVRIIAATNRNLQEDVKAGRFREDLYYRLNVIPVTIPPLRERKEDIPNLLEFFMDKYRGKLSRYVRLSKVAVDMLLTYDYPGNVRELENIIERCVTLSTGSVIGRDELPPFIENGAYAAKNRFLSDVAAEAEKDHIINVLKTTQGNKTKGAELLGISRKTLWEKMHAYGIE